MNTNESNELTFVEQECREWLVYINQSIDKGYLGEVSRAELKMVDTLYKMIPDTYLEQLHKVYCEYINFTGIQKDNLRRVIVAQIITQEKSKLQTAS